MSLQEEVTARLVAEYGFKVKGNRLLEGRCPACGQSEAYTPPGNPKVLICNRSKHCGVKTQTRSLFPDLYNNLARHHPATKSDPHATARAALAERGFRAKQLESWRAAGWWRQGQCRIEQPDKSTRVYPSIRFDLPGARIHNHRLIDYTGGDKTRTYGKYSGHVWAPPGFEPGGDIWVTEAVLDSLSLIAAGLQSVSVLSASHLPAAWLDSLAKLKPDACRLVIAYDNDKAGRAGALRLADGCEQRDIPHVLALPPKGRDWNDLLVMGDLEGAPKK